VTLVLVDEEVVTIVVDVVVRLVVVVDDVLVDDVVVDDVVGGAKTYRPSRLSPPGGVGNMSFPNNTLPSATVIPPSSDPKTLVLYRSEPSTDETAYMEPSMSPAKTTPGAMAMEPSMLPVVKYFQPYVPLEGNSAASSPCLLYCVGMKTSGFTPGVEG
jgi:hypothetical protein